MATTLAREPTIGRRPKPQSDGDPELRRYIYCLTDCDEPRDFECAAVGDRASRVHTVVHNGIAAVVSPSCLGKYTIDRQNTLAHQRVMEHVMAQGHTVLPVKFDTIAEAKNGTGPEERIVQQVLVKRFDELASLLAVMATLAEMGLKALWRDKRAVFQEIVDSDDGIRRLRDKVAGQEGGAPAATLLELGERVKNALDAKKQRERKELLGALGDLVEDVRRNKTFGDQMFANLALLLERAQVNELDSKLDELDRLAAGRIKLRYVGPVPPSNFIELTIEWDE